ncbi:MAG: rpoE 1 [Gemmataceae bacterium]|nr:rpoE 1 [Gemmataceae bacterium]
MTCTATYSPPDVASGPQPPETRLLERVRDRTNAGAWAEFVDVYQPVLRAFVRRQGVGEADVPDVVQDIFARLIPALARFEFDPSRGRFRTWLWRITSNAATNWSRKRVSRARAEAVWCRHQPAEPAGNDAPDERDQVRLQQILDQVLAEVRGTTLPATWACFEGRVLRDRPAAELATELGVSLNSVYVNACRVRAQVREQCTRYPLPVDWI